MRKTLMDDIVSRIAESAVRQFVQRRPEQARDQVSIEVSGGGGREGERGKGRMTRCQVLDDYTLDGQAVRQSSFRIGGDDPMSEFSMFRIFRADPGSGKLGPFSEPPLVTRQHPPQLLGGK